MGRKKMGAEGILSKRTGGQALAEVISDGPPVRVYQGKVPAVAIELLQERGAAPASSAGTTEPVMYRVTPAQRQALSREAFRRAELKGSGKPDASEVLREVLEAWMEAR